ncbi:MAG: hypothetical protein IID08_08985 [Candidatus Hydrogenedentes bacterium]|nr:hypothetical protein [Candidatus Hydrogenedentota bacterium]
MKSNSLQTLARIAIVSVASFLVPLVLGFSGPAHAWGPSTQISIVTTSVHVLSQDRQIPLLRLELYVLEGARISETELKALYPNFDLNPIGTAEREIYLLQSVRGRRVDAYFAYRLGTLGKLVARLSAPMSSARPDLRQQYSRDTDLHIRGAEIKTSPRTLVDSQAYLTLLVHDATAQDDTIIVDYSSGMGFEGLARASLSIDVSRAVDAVADVWFTIFVSDVQAINVSVAHIRDYSLAALEYFLNHDKLTEADEMYGKVTSLGVMTSDLRKEIGDAYFDTGHFEDAMEHYRLVLEKEPGRRDVVVKIAGYYGILGEEAASEGRLEDARNAYAAALNADVLDMDAQRKLRKAGARLLARDQRLMDARVNILAARDKEVEAEGVALGRNFAEAISLLREAESRYASVNDEFPAEGRAAELGRKNVTLRIRELKGELIRNAQSLSGSGFTRDARHRLKHDDGLSEAALHSMLDNEFNTSIRALSDGLSESLSP